MKHLLVAVSLVLPSFLAACTSHDEAAADAAGDQVGDQVGDQAGDQAGDIATGPHDVCDGTPSCGSFGVCDQLVTGATTITFNSVSRAANAVRLDDVHLVVAYPASEAPITQVLLKVVAFDGCGYAVSEPYSLTTDLVSPDVGQGLLSMGALGPNHLFLLTENPSGQVTIHFFRRDGKSLTVLGSQALAVHDEVGGHPVDDKRYLLSYRKGNSATPVNYQLLIRDGDTISFGTSIERPSPSSFPGLSTQEPQTFSPLMRVGPTTFREIRAGYVYDPGSLGSWLLTVDAANNLTASDPQVHGTSGTKTMLPLVAANGTGEGVVLYRQYNIGWLYGYFTSSPFTYHHQALLNNDLDFFHTQSQESTDGYIGGKYYVRSELGVLYRFDTVDAAAAEEATGLSWARCSKAPSILKLGAWGAFVVCDKSSASLRFLPL